MPCNNKIQSNRLVDWRSNSLNFWPFYMPITMCGNNDDDYTFAYQQKVNETLRTISFSKQNSYRNKIAVKLEKERKTGRTKTDKENNYNSNLKMDQANVSA